MKSQFSDCEKSENFYIINERNTNGNNEIGKLRIQENENR